MGPDEMYPRILRELVDDVTKTTMHQIDKFCQSHEAPTDWKKRNI